MTREIRIARLGGLEVRAADDGAPPGLSGIAAVYDSESVPIMGLFREVIKPGAFKRALSEGHDVRALFNHDVSGVLGRTKSNTLRLSDSDKGLRIELDMPDTQLGRDLLVSVRRGDIDGMSFAFRAVKESWVNGGSSDGLDLREIEDLILYDVSPVTSPAYPETSVSKRSAEDGIRMHGEFRGSIRQAEDDADRAMNMARARQAQALRRYR